MLLFFTGDARIMGKAAAEFEHFQVGAEEESTGGSGRPQLLRQLLRFLVERQQEIHDFHHTTSYQ